MNNMAVAPLSRLLFIATLALLCGAHDATLARAQAVKTSELDRTLATKKLELMVGLQQKLAGVGRTDDKLDAEIGALAAQVAEWRAQDEAKSPKAKRAAALNVIKDGSGAGSNAAANLAKARTEQD